MIKLTLDYARYDDPRMPNLTLYIKSEEYVVNILTALEDTPSKYTVEKVDEYD